MSVKINQDNVTERKPSRLVSFSCFAFLEAIKKIKNNKMEMPDDNKNGREGSL
jgi:hypothetical protein